MTDVSTGPGKPAPPTKKTSLNKAIYKQLRIQIKGILDPVLSFGDVRITRVSHVDGSISFRVPFWLPPPSPDNVRWLTTLEEQRSLRQTFAVRLEAELNRFLEIQLKEYLLERMDIEHYDPSIQKIVRRLFQKLLAGRPAYAHSSLNPPEKKLLLDVRKSVESFRDAVKQLAAKNLTDRDIRGHLRESVTSHEERYLKLFLRHCSKIPRRRYDRYEHDPDAYSTDTKLSEPNEWDLVRITARIAYHEILAATGKRYTGKVLAEAARRKRRSATTAKIGGKKS